MSKRPNGILIVAADMGYGDFGVFNDGPARPPHLDALVGEEVEAERWRIQPDGSILEIVDD